MGHEAGLDFSEIKKLLVDLLIFWTQTVHPIAQSQYVCNCLNITFYIFYVICDTNRTNARKIVMSVLCFEDAFCRCPSARKRIWHNYMCQCHLNTTRHDSLYQINAAYVTAVFLNTFPVFASGRVSAKCLPCLLHTFGYLPLEEYKKLALRLMF